MRGKRRSVQYPVFPELQFHYAGLVTLFVFLTQDLLATATKIHRVDGAPWFLPANQVLAGGSLAGVEALGSRRQGWMGGRGSGGG